MVKRVVMTGIILLLSIVLFSGYGYSEKGLIANLPVDGYKLVWSDEFEGENLDFSKWSYRALGRRNDAINVKNTINLDGKGHLALTTKRSGDKYHTAMIGTQGKFQTTFGYFEARVKFQTQAGHLSAFWLQSPTYGNPLGDPKKAGTEIDIFEYLRAEGEKEGEQIWQSIHWDGYKKPHAKCESIIKKAPGLGKGWHTVGLLWNNKEYVFYVDGKETGRMHKAISHRSEYIILSLAVLKWAGKGSCDISQAKLPDHFYVDYVRVYKKM